MITLNDKQSFTDVSIIIQMMPKKMKQQINPSFIAFIEKNKDNNYISCINRTIPIKEQQLTENTKKLLALIYRDYLCSPSLRRKLLSQEQEEKEKIESEKREKYKIEFKNNKKIQNTESKENSLVVYKKESIFKKIYNKIKKILT